METRLLGLDLGGRRNKLATELGMVEEVPEPIAAQLAVALALKESPSYAD